MATVYELKQRAQQSSKHIVAASADVAWGLSVEELNNLEIKSSRFNRMMARYNESHNPETLGLIRQIVADAIQHAQQD